LSGDPNNSKKTLTEEKYKYEFIQEIGTSADVITHSNDSSVADKKTENNK